MPDALPATARDTRAMPRKARATKRYLRETEADKNKVRVVICNLSIIVLLVYACFLSWGSLALLLFLLLLPLLEYLDLLIILHQPLLEPEVVLRFDVRRPVILIGLLLFLDLF